MTKEMLMNESPRIPWNDSVWFFDIDDTLIDTAGTTIAASEGIARVFSTRYGDETGKKIQREFNGIFETMLGGYRVKSEDDWNTVPGGKPGFDSLLSDIESCQTRIIERYGSAKKWSREVFVALASARAGIKVSPETVHEAADAYWMELTEQTSLFPSAKALIDIIHEHGRPVYLVTSSDARLKMAPDGQFDYDPAYSEGLKRERIELLREKGLRFNAVSIGDPLDKPHREFFGKGLDMAAADLGMPVRNEHAIMVGDSYAGDLATPKDILGFGLVVLFRKNDPELVVNDPRQVTTGTLDGIVGFLA